MIPYPNRCPSCKSPSRNRNSGVMCSNTRCKTWYRWRKSISPVEYIKDTEGDTPENPIIIICQNCGKSGWYLARGNLHFPNGGNEAVCSYCHKWSRYNYEIGKWYKSSHINGIEHFIGGDKYGGWENQPLSAWKNGF